MREGVGRSLRDGRISRKAAKTQKEAVTAAEKRGGRSDLVTADVGPRGLAKGYPKAKAWGMFYPFKNTALWRWEVRSLAERDDIRTIGLVVDMWERDSGRRTTHDTSPRLGSLLIRLLLRLEAKDYYLLNERHRRYLHEELKGYNAPLVLAIVQALKQVGDSKAIRYVEALAQGRGVAARNSRIRAAAEECLPVLRARAELEQWLSAQP